MSQLFENFEIYKDLYRKPFKRDKVAKVVFLNLQILPIFGGRCNRYLWDRRLKIDRLPNFNTLSAPANKILQKRAVIVFTESWSRDRLMQKAYC